MQSINYACTLPLVIVCKLFLALDVKPNPSRLQVSKTGANAPHACALINALSNTHSPLISNCLTQVVMPEWLEESLAQGRKVAEDEYRVHLEFCCDSGKLWQMVPPVELLRGH